MAKYKVCSNIKKEKFKKKILSYLNKLTLEKFDKLSAQLVTYVKEAFVEFKESLDSVALLTELVSQIFDKALGEKYFASMYSGLCNKLTSELPTFEREEGQKKVSFKKILLNQCQIEFEKGRPVFSVF